MTQSEAEKVMMEERPVKCKGIEYRKIDSVITRKRDGKKYVPNRPARQGRKQHHRG